MSRCQCAAKQPYAYKIAGSTPAVVGHGRFISCASRLISSLCQCSSLEAASGSNALRAGFHLLGGTRHAKHQVDRARL